MFGAGVDLIADIAANLNWTKVTFLTDSLEGKTYLHHVVLQRILSLPLEAILSQISFILSYLNSPQIMYVIILLPDTHFIVYLITNYFVKNMTCLSITKSIYIS